MIDIVQLRKGLSMEAWRITQRKIFPSLLEVGFGRHSALTLKKVPFIYYVSTCMAELATLKTVHDYVNKKTYFQQIWLIQMIEAILQICGIK